MKTRIFAILLICALAISLFACGNNTDQPSVTTAASTQASEQTTLSTQETTSDDPTTQTPPASTKVEIDLSNGIPYFITKDLTGSQTNVTLEAQDEMPYLSLKDDTDKGRASVLLQFDAVDDVITVSYRIRFNALSTYTLGLISSASNPSDTLAQLVARPTGKLCAYNGKAEKEIGTYTVGEWMNITVRSYLKTGSFTVSLNENPEDGVLFNFLNERKTASCYVWNTHQSGIGGMDIAKITVDPFLPPPNPDIPSTNINHVTKIPLVSSDDVKDNLNYLAFPTTALIGDEVWIAYKRGYSHTSDYSDLDLTILNRADNSVISTYTVDSSKEVRFQNPELVTMPNGETVLYVDVQQKGTSTRLGIYTYHFRLSGGGFSERAATSLKDDLGIEYGYVFDSVIDGNTLYMLAMTFPELENQGHGRSVHLIKTEDNGKSFAHVASLTSLLGVSINESALFLENGVFVLLSRGDDGYSYMMRMTTNGELLKSVNLSDTYQGISYMGRPSFFKENGTYYFMGRNIPTENKNEQELAIFEFDFDTLHIKNKLVLDTRSGTGGDAYYAESFVSNIGGTKTFCVINYGTSFSKKPSIELLTVPYDQIFK